MTTTWELSGDYVEACNCDVACQCIWLEPPDDDVCTATLAWHVADGRYGDVDLSGRNVAMLIETAEGVMFAPSTEWDVVLLVEETATTEQREAIEDVYLGRAGGIWAAAADGHYRSTEVATAPIAFDRDGDTTTVSVGDDAALEAVEKRGFGDQIGRVSPHPLTASGEMKTGKSTRSTVSYDDRFAWDVGGNNAYVGAFELTNA
jgi:hypothetical protein